MLSKEDVTVILNPYKKRINQCIVDGWHEAKESYCGVSHIHSPITRPSLIRDHIIHHLRQTFNDVDGVLIIEKNNSLFLCIDWKLLIRFKKFDSNLHTSNNPTHQSRAFNLQMTLFEGTLGDVINLNAGYMPDELWTAIKGVYITCPKGEEIEWNICIDGNELVASDVSELFSSQHDEEQDTEIISVREELLREKHHEKGTRS